MKILLLFFGTALMKSAQRSSLRKQALLWFFVGMIIKLAAQDFI